MLSGEHPRRRPRSTVDEGKIRVELRVRNIDLGDTLREYIERSLGFTVGRFGEPVGRVRVEIYGLNGSRGAPLPVVAYPPT
jgi:hypothetical protein